MSIGPKVTLRTTVCAADSRAVQAIVTSTGFFSAREIAVAVELIDDRLEHGEASHYHFIFADDDTGQPVGYACYGRIPDRPGAFDLYWIAVCRDRRGGGVGRILMRECERLIRHMAGADPVRLCIDTAPCDQYAPTRRFYERNDYLIAETRDGHAPEDATLTFVKVL